jgi:vacuole morphology and inheritance protein 14
MRELDGDAFFLQEKRKIGALEVEQLVKDLRAQGELVKLKRMITYLTDNYVYSVNGNSKKGGLIALAAVVIGLQQETYRFLHLVIPPMLKCFR